MNEVIIYVDGATRGNPGPASIAAVIKNEQGRTITTSSERIGTSTNNQAEYRAIILGLKKAIALGARFIEVRSDSELVVRQINGGYRVRNSALMPLYQQVKQLEYSLEGFAVNHISRQDNNEANDLAKRTLNLVRHLNYPQNCQLLLKVKQTDNENSDIPFLHRLIGILKDFPGRDQVKLSVGANNIIVNLKLTNTYVNYCHELREQLRGMLGKRGIIVKQLV